MNPTLKRFIMTLGATTVSIILTFGTTAIIDRSKKRAAKREMVMMIMYDMRESLSEIGKINEDMKAFFETQLDVIAHPEKLVSSYLDLASKVPIMQYTTTTENIFRSNIETIQTIGNILFTEAVSSFYDGRVLYKERIVDYFASDPDGLVSDYGRLYDFNTPSFIFYGEALYNSMNSSFEQCKLMMKVTDKDLDVFSRQQKKLAEATRVNLMEETAQSSADNAQRKDRLEKAREEGRRNR